MRHAHGFQSAVCCPASFLAAPICADLGPSRLDLVEEAGTAASFNQAAAVSGKLQTHDRSVVHRTWVVSGMVPTHDPSVTPLRCWSKGVALSRVQHCTAPVTHFVKNKCEGRVGGSSRGPGVVLPFQSSLYVCTCTRSRS